MFLMAWFAEEDVRSQSNLTTCQENGTMSGMKFVSVGEFKAHFSDLLQEVIKGESVGVCFGRRKKPVAALTPVPQHGSKTKRPLGLWQAEMSFRFQGGGKFTDDEFLAA